MVKIRLMRVGAKNNPHYRIVALDKRRKRNGRALEFLGTFDPKTDPARFQLRRERVEAWLKQGAQLSEAVRALWRRPLVVTSEPDSLASKPQALAREPKSGVA